MEENRAENQTPQRQHAQAKTHQAHKKKGGTVKKVIGTILAIGLTTCLMFFAIFMIYVHTSLDLDVDISAYTLKQSSTVYYQDKTHRSPAAMSTSSLSAPNRSTTTTISSCAACTPAPRRGKPHARQHRRYSQARAGSTHLH